MFLEFYSGAYLVIRLMRGQSDWIGNVMPLVAVAVVYCFFWLI